MNNLRQFFADKALELLVAGVCLQLALAAVAVWLANSPAIMLLLALSVLLLLFVFTGVKELRARRKRPQIGGEEALQVPRKGVIFTLGLHSAKPGSVVYLVVDKLKPEFIGFLGTPETEKAEVVKTLCRALELPEGKCKSESWKPTAIREGKIKTGLVLDWMLEQYVSESNVVLDLTGGTATMSVAAFMAAEERRIDCQYIYSKFDVSKNQIVPGSQEAILITHYARPEDSPGSD
ncbi:MAG: hypothetical protein LC754_05120 [Acidobacteria bacterium]|nr:hypothetical protein [Acidobacteriota bacterium]